MRSASIVLFILILPVLVFAQAPDSLWSRNFGGTFTDECNSIQQTSDGGYILAGYTYSFGQGGRDFWWVKTDTDGLAQSTHTFGGDHDDECRCIEQTSDGGFILTGYTYPRVPGYNDLCVIKTDTSGSLIWSRILGGNSYDEGQSIQQTLDGGYIVAGQTASFGAGDWDFWLVRMDSNGDSVWSHTFGGAYPDICYSVQQTTDSGYILAGYTQSHTGGQDFYMVKTDSLGDTQWARTYGGADWDRATSVQQTSDGGYVLGGWTDSFGAGNKDFWLVKTDSVGDTLWTRTLGGNSDDVCYSVRQSTDGGYILAGYTFSFGVGISDAWLVKVDASGDSIWSRTFGGSHSDMCNSVRQTSDEGYILGGLTNSYGTASSGDFWMVKTGPEYPNVGYVTLIQPGPPDWGYQLNWVSGSLSRFTFTNFCDGTVGSVGGAATAAGWIATNYADSIVFMSSTPLTSGTIDTFWLSHPWCSDVVDWTVGDSSGSVDGPLPVEMTTFQAIAGDGQVTLQWRTESELDNDHFILYKRKAGEEDFHAFTEIPGHGTTSEPHDYQFVDSWVQNGIAYDYQISDVDIAGRETFYEQIVSATPGSDIVPTEFSLHQNYPNPFNPVTTIRYDVKEVGLVSLKVFDLLGREVTTLTHEEHSAGSYSVTWNAAGMPSGIYLCRMETEGFAQVRKLLLVK